jgi:serine/threonine-protein kinase HipA
MPDYQAVVWTRAGGTPIKMGSLYVTDEAARFQYTPDYAETGLAGLSLVYPPAAYRDRPVVYRRPGQLHPRLRALVPPHGEQNFQRKMLLGLLRAQGKVPAPGFEEDWALLMLAGHGGIGHVDVFGDDEAARAWYAQDMLAPLVPVGERLGRTLRDLIRWLDADAAALLQTLGPTPSVGGAIPKLLLAIPAEGWTGEIAVPTRTPQSDRIDVVLKIERSDAYPGIAELEAMALEVHRAAGLDVPRHWRCQVAGLPALAVGRFDRDPAGHPLPLESWYAILAAGARDVTTHYDGSLDRIGKAIDLPALTLVGDRRAARAHLYLRLLMALLSGNGDLHLDNLAILGAGENARFSPVYDPTPMRAYSLHNMLTPIPFGDYGELLPGSDTPVPLEPALRRFASHLGLRPRERAALLHRALAATEDYVDRIRALATLPPEHKRRLEEIVVGLRQRFGKLA